MSEKSPACPYTHIAIEGVIGVGKTSLCLLLAELFGGRCLLEDVDANPFIAEFYRSPRATAFKTQLFYLISRFKKQTELPPPDLFQSPLVTDYIFQKDRIFATVNLDDPELELYNTLWCILEPRVKPPDVVVYLQASTQRLLERIKKRGREYERSMSQEYLEALNNAYNEFFFHYTAAPVFIVNTNDIDFVESPAHLRDLAARIVEPKNGISFYHPGGM